MRSPDAWSQSPGVHTVRTIGSVEGRFTGAGDLYVRSAFHMTELRLPPVRQGRAVGQLEVPQPADRSLTKSRPTVFPSRSRTWFARSNAAWPATAY